MQGSDFSIDPKRFRRQYVAFLLAGLALIWTAYLAGGYLVRKNLDQTLLARMRSESVVLEDHVSRTLDAVAATLRSAAALTRPGDVEAGRLSPRALHDMIFEDPSVRSVALVDDHGRIVASSSEREVGVVLPPGTLPEWSSRSGSVQLGRVFPHRDLRELAAGTPGDARLWLAALAVDVDGRRYQWVAVINPGFFQNFWERVGRDPTIAFGLFDYQGRRIVSHRPVLADERELASALLVNVERQDQGVIDLGDDGRFIVAYRASLNHPAVFAMIGDRELAWASRAEDHRWITAIALGASALLVLVVALLYRWYLRYEASIAEMTNQARAIGAHLMVTETSPEGNIIAANTAFLAASGYPAEEVIGKNHRIFSSGLHPRSMFEGLWSTVTQGNIWKGTLRNRGKSGRYFWVNATIVPFTDAWGRITRYVTFYSDITEAVSLSEKVDSERLLREELSRVNHALFADATTDALTGLANRRGLDRFWEKVIALEGPGRRPTSVLVLDLDRFKSVNDEYGHAAGDAVLREVARRWSSLIRASDMLARIGGEEFCVLLPNTSRLQARRVADKILAGTSAKPVAVPVGDTAATLRVTVSVGVASADYTPDLSLETLLGAADQALYEAKRGGRNRVAADDEIDRRIRQAS
jgi:diguanylate cyclase (GGDEF)-like protein/PAS domain S-box-containing protein